VDNTGTGQHTLDNLRLDSHYFLGTIAPVDFLAVCFCLAMRENEEDKSTIPSEKEEKRV